ncbi:unnamed protein product, partial [Rotaria sp. Silwood2]
MNYSLLRNDLHHLPLTGK